MKRHDLATSSGIDHDYNYLTSIERQLDSAERNALERGFLLKDQDSEQPAWKQQGLNGPRKGEMPMKAAIERCGVIVERAPEGMARRKQNVTGWDRKCASGWSDFGMLLTKYRRHRLIWTVEWIRTDGGKEYGQCPEFDRIQDAFAAHARSTSSKEDLKHEQDIPPRKRAKHGTKAMSAKRADYSHTMQDSARGDPLIGPMRKESNLVAQPEPSNRPSKDPSLETPVIETNGQLKDRLLDREKAPLPELTTHSNNDQACGQSMQTPTSLDVQQDQTIPKNSNDKVLNDMVFKESPSDSLYFYLHAPRLPSSEPVLIPLAPDSSLSECLRNHLVLEFPTIYVLDQPANDLPCGYITEDGFDKKMQQEDFRDNLMAKLTGNEEGEIETAPKHEEDVDAKKLEDVLIRDLRQSKGKP